jgi:hypothetical protein
MHAYTLWIATLAYALHIVEEYTFDWKNWAIAVLRLPVSWTHFALVNGVVVVLGIACSSVAWSLPAFALSLPALMLINASCMHVLPFLATRGRFSPGLFTAILLFFPISLWAYYGAYQDGVLSVRIAILSLAIGALEMAFPIVMLKLRLHPYFKQT